MEGRSCLCLVVIGWRVSSPLIDLQTHLLTLKRKSRVALAGKPQSLLPVPGCHSEKLLEGIKPQPSKKDGHR